MTCFRVAWESWGWREERTDHTTREAAEQQQAELAFAGIDALVYRINVEESA